VRSQPFNHHFSGRKYDADSNETNTAYSAFVLITQQFKDSHVGARILHNSSTF